ncbi:hypothetical protein VT98_11963 [Candidatus Electrothrix communis]|uniref:DUF5666 domain-containing protein n=1 Tax=Candidatus Electrothrix communis TaxID=1859133 RepID=A0A3S3UB78_9BACT|nr:hypothetical protein VT98_11963 [Candidatus Electrothrix communis]
MICTKKTAILTLSLATTWSVNALAQPQNSISQPPSEAYTACEGKQPGKKASFVTQTGNTISGQCKQQQDGRLILIPDHLREASRIPPAAYQKCVGKRLGDAAQVTIPTGETVSGTCQSDGDRLYLRPDSPPGMNAGIHAGMKTHKGGQYQKLRNGSSQPDPQQQAPHYQQQSTPPEGMHSNVQQQQEPNTQQQAPRQNKNNSSYGNQQQQPQQAERGNGKANPPEAAYKTCEGKRAGDEVQLTTPQGTKITGTCEQGGDRLFFQLNRLGTPNGNTSSGNVQQHQADPTNSVEKPEQQQSQPPQQPVQNPVQNPEEKPKGPLAKMKELWKKLW